MKIALGRPRRSSVSSGGGKHDRAITKSLVEALLSALQMRGEIA